MSSRKALDAWAPMSLNTSLAVLASRVVEFVNLANSLAFIAPVVPTTVGNPATFKSELSLLSIKINLSPVCICVRESVL